MSCKRDLDAATLERLKRSADAAQRALDELTGRNGVGYYVPVKHVDRLVRARRDLNAVLFALTEKAFEDGVSHDDVRRVWAQPAPLNHQP